MFEAFAGWSCRLEAASSRESGWHMFMARLEQRHIVRAIGSCSGLLSPC